MLSLSLQNYNSEVQEVLNEGKDTEAKLKGSEQLMTMLDGLGVSRSPAYQRSVRTLYVLVLVFTLVFPEDCCCSG